MGDFESPGFNTTTYKQFGGGSQTAAAACNGAFGGQIAISTAVPRSGFMIDLSTLAGQTNNGQKLDFSVSYKKGATVTGTLQLAYFSYDSVSDLWSINYVGTPVTLTAPALTTCSTLTASLPAGTLQPGGIYGIGAFFTRTGTGAGNIFLDDINLAQDTTVTTAPACTTVSNPVAGSTVSAGNLLMTWATAPTAVNYKVTVGTTPGGSEVYNGTVAGTSLNLSLAKSTTYYAKVVPSNGNGDATGCTEISFTSNNTIGYCAIAGSPVFAMSSVSLAGTTNTSPATAAPVYEDFTSTVFNVKSGSTYTLDVIATGAGTNNIFGMTAFVDWNEDGDFNDTGEQYFQGTPLKTGASNVINFTGSIAVPAGTTVGTKRMRVKYNFNGSATVLSGSLSDPCADMANGQTEDYTISVTLLTDAPVCTTFTAPTDMSTNFPANGTMTWAAAQDATSYKIYIGTTPGGTDVVNGTVVTTTSYVASLTPGMMYYAKVVPSNSVGDAAGCTEISFTAASYLYCAATATSITPTYERISRVEVSDIDNVSNVTAASKGAGYEDFTSITGNVRRGSTNPITVTIDNYDNDQTAVWIDFNQNGVFEESEKTVLSTAASSTGSIVVPTTAVLGNTRMRVRINYNSAPPACGNTTFGQVEDYTINIEESLAVNTNVKSSLSVYPNPFQDVLKISDVKGVKSITVTDVSGRMVKNMKPSAELNLSDLKTGLFIVTLHMEDGTVKSFKTIKK